MVFGTFTESAFLTVDAAYEFFLEGSNALVLTLNPRETATFAFNVDAPGITDDLEIEVLQGHRISTGNGLDGSTSSSDLELDTAADGFATDDDMNGLFIVMTSGDEQGEGRLIVDSVAADDGVNLFAALSAAPSATETYDLYRLSAVYNFKIDPQTTITDDLPNNARVTVDAADGQFVLVRARADGVTDAHRVQMSYQVDGVSI